MTLPQLGWRSAPSEPIVSGVFRPPPLFIVIGQPPVCWSPRPGGPIRCSPCFISVISGMSLTRFVLWVRLWLQVSGSDLTSSRFCLGEEENLVVHFSAFLAVLLPFLGLVVEPALLAPDQGVVFCFCYFVMYCPYIFFFFFFFFFIVYSPPYTVGFCRVTVLWGLQT